MGKLKQLFNEVSVDGLLPTLINPTTAPIVRLIKGKKLFGKETITDQYDPRMIEERINHLTPNKNFNNAVDKNPKDRQWMTNAYKDNVDDNIYNCINTASGVIMGNGKTIASNLSIRDKNTGEYTFRNIPSDSARTGDLIQFTRPTNNPNLQLPFHANVVKDHNYGIITTKGSNGKGSVQNNWYIRTNNKKFYRFEPTNAQREQVNNPETNPEHHTLTIYRTPWFDIKRYKRTNANNNNR